MCGRYALTAEEEALAVAMGVERIFTHHRPRYNVAPTQSVPVVRWDEEGPRLDPLRWGLVPFWASDPSVGNRMINARCESVAERPAFREAYRRRRCLVPADGFYEWKPEGTGKQPHWLGRPGRAIFGMAGLWERWGGGDGGGGELLTFTILTREATGVAVGIHPRMPLILPRESWPLWLGSGTSPGDRARLLESEPPIDLLAYPVSRVVNAPANDVPECVAPLAE